MKVSRSVRSSMKSRIEDEVLQPVVKRLETHSVDEQGKEAFEATVSTQVHRNVWRPVRNAIDGSVQAESQALSTE